MFFLKYLNEKIIGKIIGVKALCLGFSLIAIKIYCRREWQKRDEVNACLSEASLRLRSILSGTQGIAKRH